MVWWMDLQPVNTWYRQDKHHLWRDMASYDQVSQHRNNSSINQAGGRYSFATLSYCSIIFIMVSDGSRTSYSAHTTWVNNKKWKMIPYGKLECLNPWWIFAWRWKIYRKPSYSLSFASMPFLQLLLNSNRRRMGKLHNLNAFDLGRTCCGSWEFVSLWHWGLEVMSIQSGA